MVTLQPTLQMRCTEALGKAWGRGLSCRVEVRGLVQRSQGGKGIKHAAGRGRAPHCHYALATCLRLRPGSQWNRESG